MSQRERERERKRDKKDEKRRTGGNVSRLFLVAPALGLECQSEKCQRINQLFMRIHFSTPPHWETIRQKASHLGEGKLKRLINERSHWDKVFVNTTEGSMYKEKKKYNLWHN